jgi:hypothetical protein
MPEPTTMGTTGPAGDTERLMINKARTAERKRVAGLSGPKDNIAENIKKDAE